MATQIIQMILAPVVMVSVAAILLVGLLGRYAAISDRLRALSIERLELLAHANSDDRLPRRVIPALAKPRS